MQYIIKHRLYSKPVPNANDIALIKLSRSAKLNHFVNTVCLPRQYSNVLPGTKCFVTGDELLEYLITEFKNVLVGTSYEKSYDTF